MHYFFFQGSITMQLYKTYEISCKAYVAKFPLDSVSCDMKLLGIYDTSYLRFIPWNSSMDDQIVFKNSNSEWIVKNLTFHSKQEKQRLFETEYTTEMMNIHMLIQRSPEYYIIILQIPMCLLTAMLIMTSWIPPSSGERIGFVINLCLSFILFLLLLDSLLPRSNYSAMSLCVLFNYVLSILNLLECVVVNYFHHRYNCDDAVCHPVTSIANDLTTPREIHFFDGTEKLKWIRYLQRLDTIMFAVNVVSLIVMIISLLSTLLSWFLRNNGFIDYFELLYYLHSHDCNLIVIKSSHFLLFSESYCLVYVHIVSWLIYK